MTKKVLVVDDLPEACELMSKLLKAGGYDPIGASNGREALATMAREMPQLVLLDLSMPEMDGFEVLRVMRADSGLRDIRVILFTALLDVVDAKQFKVDDIIVKGTIGGVELLERIARVLPK